MQALWHRNIGLSILPKPLGWRSFYSNDLNLIVETAQEVGGGDSAKSVNVCKLSINWTNNSPVLFIEGACATGALLCLGLIQMRLNEQAFSL